MRCDISLGLIHRPWPLVLFVRVGQVREQLFRRESYREAVGILLAQLLVSIIADELERKIERKQMNKRCN